MTSRRPAPVFNKSTAPLIEAQARQFTPAERKIAAYFLHEAEDGEAMNAKAVAQRLAVSEAALTRFAQKCGFRGFREFAYAFSQDQAEAQENFTQPVLSSYQELLSKTYSLVDTAQIHRITTLLQEKKRVYFYGKGSSGLVAQEMKLRFMRVGLICDAFTDNNMMRMNAVLTDKHCLVIGISISGRSAIVLSALDSAKKQGAAAVLLTANAAADFHARFDEVQRFAVKNNLEYGRMISPQFPALVVLDMLYADYMQHHPQQREKIWRRTYDAIQLNKE